MRLIDADRPIPRRWNGAIGQYEPCVDDAPTIEAIPIEWLQQFVYTKPDVIEHIIVLWRREQEQGDDKG